MDEYIYYVFAGIGFVILLYYAVRIFFELMYLVIFTIGYLILHLLNYNWQKVRKNKYGALKDTLKIINWGFQAAFDSPTEFRLGLWVWKPLFNLKKQKSKKGCA